MFLYTVHNKDKNVRSGAGCVEEIFLGNHFLLRAGLDVANFVADNMERLSSNGYGYINTSSDDGKIGKLGSQLLDLDCSNSHVTPIPEQKTSTQIANGDLPLQSTIKKLTSVTKMKLIFSIS